MPTRTARTAWNGTLEEGAGQVELSSSKAGTFDVSFPKRAADEAGGTTSPEELIAAAHSSCVIERRRGRHRERHRPRDAVHGQVARHRIRGGARPAEARRDEGDRRVPGRVEEVRTTGRNAQGVKVINIGDKDRVISAFPVRKEDEL